MNDLTLIHHPDYSQWVFDPTHPTQGRRFVKGAQQLLMLASSCQLAVDVVEPDAPATRELLDTVHTPEYLSRLLDRHECEEWDGARPDMSRLAALFVEGTLTALDHLTTGRTLTAINLPGAKHHAHADHASGFCVLADFAIAAHAATELGHRVAILDIDAHHGDGTEALCADNPAILTYSVHQHGIFPGTGHADRPERQAYNWLQAAGAGDRALRTAMLDFVDVAHDHRPTIVFLAAGADGHVTDPLSDLNYTVEGYAAAAALVRREFPELPILMGGAGGYQPDAATPLVWAATAVALSAAEV